MSKLVYKQISSSQWIILFYEQSKDTFLYTNYSYSFLASPLPDDHDFFFIIEHREHLGQANRILCCQTVEIQYCAIAEVPFFYYDLGEVFPTPQALYQDTGWILNPQELLNAQAKWSQLANYWQPQAMFILTEQQWMEYNALLFQMRGYSLQQQHDAYITYTQEAITTTAHTVSDAELAQSHVFTLQAAINLAAPETTTVIIDETIKQQKKEQALAAAKTMRHQLKQQQLELAREEILQLFKKLDEKFNHHDLLLLTQRLKGPATNEIQAQIINCPDLTLNLCINLLQTQRKSKKLKIPKSMLKAILAKMSLFSEQEYQGLKPKPKLINAVQPLHTLYLPEELPIFEEIFAFIKSQVLLANPQNHNPKTPILETTPTPEEEKPANLAQEHSENLSLALKKSAKKRFREQAEFVALYEKQGINFLYNIYPHEEELDEFIEFLNSLKISIQIFVQLFKIELKFELIKIHLLDRALEEFSNEDFFELFSLGMQYPKFHSFVESFALEFRDLFAATNDKFTQGYEIENYKVREKICTNAPDTLKTIENPKYKCLLCGQDKSLVTCVMEAIKNPNTDINVISFLVKISRQFILATDNNYQNVLHYWSKYTIDFDKQAFAKFKAILNAYLAQYLASEHAPKHEPVHKNYRDFLSDGNSENFMHLLIKNPNLELEFLKNIINHIASKSSFLLIAVMFAKDFVGNSPYTILELNPKFSKALDFFKNQLPSSYNMAATQRDYFLENLFAHSDLTKILQDDSMQLEEQYSFIKQIIARRLTIKTKLSFLAPESNITQEHELTKEIYALYEKNDEQSLKQADLLINLAITHELEHNSANLIYSIIMDILKYKVSIDLAPKILASIFNKIDSPEKNQKILNHIDHRNANLLWGGVAICVYFYAFSKKDPEQTKNYCKSLILFKQLLMSGVDLTQKSKNLNILEHALTVYDKDNISLHLIKVFFNLAPEKLQALVTGDMIFRIKDTTKQAELKELFKPTCSSSNKTKFRM